MSFYLSVSELLVRISRPLCTRCFFTNKAQILGNQKTPDGIRPAFDKLRIFREYPTRGTATVSGPSTGCGWQVSYQTHGLINSTTLSTSSMASRQESVVQRLERPLEEAQQALQDKTLPAEEATLRAEEAILRVEAILCAEGE